MALMKPSTAPVGATNVQQEPLDIPTRQEQEYDSRQLRAAEPQNTSLPATATTSSGMGMSINQFISEAAEAGFAGLHIDWTSFPTIKLDTDGMFKTSDDQIVGKEFIFRSLGSREQYVYRGTKFVNNKPDTLVAFSYDKIVAGDGRTLEEVFNAWVSEGRTVEPVKTYLELMAETSDGMITTLQIPPTSRGRFTGAVAVAAMKRRTTPADVLANSNFRAYVGNKIQSDSSSSFFPWMFEYVG